MRTQPGRTRFKSLRIQLNSEVWFDFRILWLFLTLLVIKAYAGNTRKIASKLFGENTFYTTVILKWREYHCWRDSCQWINMSHVEKGCCDGSTWVTFFTKWFDKSPIEWLEIPIRVNFTKSLNILLTNTVSWHSNMSFVLKWGKLLAHIFCGHCVSYWCFGIFSGSRQADTQAKLRLYYYIRTTSAQYIEHIIVVWGDIYIVWSWQWSHTFTLSYF